MRRGDDALDAGDLVVREIRHIAGDLPHTQRRQHGVVVHQLAARQIDDAHAGLHFGKFRRAEHMARALVIVYLHQNVVAQTEDGVQIGRVIDLAAEPPRRVHRQIGVVAPHVHAQILGGVCDLGADGSQTDDAKRFAHDLRADVGRLALLHLGGHVLVAGDGVDPGDAAHDVARGDQQRADGQLLDRLGVGPGRVENGDAGLGAALDRDVVRAHARARDGQQPAAERGVVQLCRADEKAVRILGIDVQDQSVCRQLVKPLLGDVVHGLYFKHDASPQNPSCIPPAPSRPPSAGRCTARRADRRRSGGP